MPTAPKTRAKNAEAVVALPSTNHPVIADPALIKMAAEYAKSAPEKNRLEKRLKELKPVLLQAMGDAPMAYAGKHVLTRAEVIGSPDTVGEKITRSMVGQHMPGKKGRPGYTTLEVR
jgi:hypothetical protein